MRRPAAPVAVVPRFKVGDRVKVGPAWNAPESGEVVEVKRWPRVVWYVVLFGGKRNSYPESQLAPA